MLQNRARSPTLSAEWSNHSCAQSAYVLGSHARAAHETRSTGSTRFTFRPHAAPIEPVSGMDKSDERGCGVYRLGSSRLDEFLSPIHSPRRLVQNSDGQSQIGFTTRRLGQQGLWSPMTGRFRVWGDLCRVVQSVPPNLNPPSSSARSVGGAWRRLAPPAERRPCQAPSSARPAGRLSRVLRLLERPHPGGATYRLPLSRSPHLKERRSSFRSPRLNLSSSR